MCSRRRLTAELDREPWGGASSLERAKASKYLASPPTRFDEDAT